MAPPTDARGFEVRGAGFLERGQDDKAIADFTQASRLDPKAARYLYDRGAAYFHKGDLLHARADFDGALRLDPADVQALMGRADLEFARDEIAAGDADYAEALRKAPGSSAVRVRRAAAYERQGRFEAAARDYDAAEAGEAPGGRQRATLLNDACFARAEWGQELEAGLAACEAALKLLPEQPDILDSEGFILFRLGRFSKAIDVYDAALRGAPGGASALFGRGLAKAALGRADEGSADIAAARAAESGIDAVFARYGVRAPAPRHPAGR
jgi:tetratricopeptide (TPR) repeat protein